MNMEDKDILTETEEIAVPEAEEIAASETEEIAAPETAEHPKRRKAAIVVSVLLALAIALCIFVMAQILSKGYVSVGNMSMFRVVTGSMEPEIPTGALLITRKTPIDQIEVGDIVTYRSGERGLSGVVITHRVIAIHESADGKRYLETKGDANRYADASYVDESHLIGSAAHYTGRNSVLARIFGFATSRTGFLACIVLPCVIIGMFTMRDCVRNLRKEMEQFGHELDSIRRRDASLILEAELGEEAYRKLCDRMRDELLKELKNEAGSEKTEEDPGAQQQQPAPESDEE